MDGVNLRVFEQLAIIRETFFYPQGVTDSIQFFPRTLADGIQLGMRMPLIDRNKFRTKPQSNDRYPDFF